MAVDGRTQRGLQTRQAVLDALEDLLAEGRAEPGARQIAARAGVSVRSVFSHFTSLEDLRQALVEQTRDRVIGLLRPIDPAGPVAERISQLCEQRARIAEEIGPLRRAAAARASSSPTLQAARGDGATASRAQLERIFARELAAFDPAERARRVAVVDASISGETWDLWREVHGLTQAEATEAMVLAVTNGLDPGLRGHRHEPGQVQDQRLLLADVEMRIDRLRAAVEAGAPSEVVGPRLAELARERDLLRLTPHQS